MGLPFNNGVRINYLDIIVTSVVFKSYSGIDTDFSVNYSGIGNVIWKDGIQELTGTSVTFNWVDDSTKTVTIEAEQPELLDGQFLVISPDIFDLYLGYSQVAVSLSRELEDGMLKRFSVPKASPPLTNNYNISYVYTNLQVLDLKSALIVDSIISIGKCSIFEEFIQPNSSWSISSFKIYETVIYNTLNLSNLTIKGGIQILSNPFLEGILFNKYSDWIECLVLIIEDSDILKFIDFSIMDNILTYDNTSIRIKNIGATQSDMDNMLNDLTIVIPNNLAVGRVVELLGGAPPSVNGLADKVILESYGIIVNL